MTAGVVTVTAEPGRKISIQVRIAHHRTVRLGVTGLTGKITIDSAVGALVTGREVALHADLIIPLLEEAIVLGTVRIMTLGAAAAFERVTVDRLMLKEERSGLLRVTVLADAIQIVGQILVIATGELVTAQTGQITLIDRMSRTTREGVALLGVTLVTELGLIIEQERTVFGVDPVTRGAVKLLLGMRVITEVVHSDMRDVTFFTGFRSRGSGLVLWVSDVFD